ncbi:MAG TPA: hypothetical protein VJ859_01215 [Allosphingosinicella sp.]|nr:hypothetical protein [Allosphingosinicella sp.]
MTAAPVATTAPQADTSIGTEPLGRVGAANAEELKGMAQVRQAKTNLFM